ASTPINPILLNRRHTVEVRVAQASQTSVGNPPANPVFAFAQVSQYKFGTRGDETSDIEALQQLQVNPLGLPLFQSGCCPFAGDYIDIAGLSFLPPAANGGTLGSLAAAANSWKFNTAPRQNSVHFATYTSNQDVRPPADGNWANYTPAGTGLGRTSVFDGTAVPNCVAGQEGMRNQNIYSSRITGGLLLSSPQNTKPLSTTLQRTFVVLGQNFTDLNKSFRLTIVNQPVGGKASFLQFPSPPQPDPLINLDVTIAANSGIARSVFATSTDPHAIIRVTAAEITGPGGAIVPDGLFNFVVLNADSTSPSLINADGAGAVGDIAVVEIFTPNISNPNISNPNISNPNVSNPNISNPNVSNPNVSNPNVSNPNVSNPDIADPNVSNPNVSNPNISNPNVSNPNISNPNVSNAPVSDATYGTTNNGNTGAAYNIKLVGTSPTPLQLIINKVHNTPAALACELFDQSQMILQSNVTSQNTIITPNISNDPLANITNPVIGNPSIFLAPGESVFITIRGNVDTATMESIITGVAPVVAAQAANSNDPTGTPQTTAPLFITTASLPDASNNEAYAATLQVIGGQPPYSWTLAEGSDSLPEGLTLNASTGEISGTPTQAGTFNLIFEVQDSSTPRRTARRALTIIVEGVVDLEAIAVAPREDTPTPWTVGQNAFIRFDIRNIGTATSSPSTPVVCTLGESTVVSTFLTAVGPGTTANLEFNFKVPGGQGTSPLLRCTVSDPADVNSENNSASTEVAIVGAITFTVTNTEDSGAGSLRQAILNANANAGFTDTINFAIPGEPPFVITPLSQLPSINEAVLLDATPSGTCSTGVVPQVEIDGISAGAAHGLLVNSAGNVIRGLAITRFTTAEFAGLFIAGGSNNVVQCSYFGLAPDGATAKGNFDGVRIGGSFNNTIGGTSEAVRNVISGNLRNGVLIMGPVEGTQGSIMQTLVQGNFIGTDVTGTQDSGNLANGVQIINSARNTIGGTGLARNVISGNSGEGVRIDGATATENLVQGNYIGLDAFGTADVGNSASGVYIRRAPANTVVGNTISGNDGFAGVAICGDLEFCGGGNAGTQGNNASGNVIKGNLIGTTAAGTAALGNSARGVSIDGAPNNTVGGPLASDGNVIAANGLNGVVIFSAADGNLVRGNSIGTDAGGTLNLGNTGAGVLIQSGANNVISGKEDDRTAPNRIRFNSGAGIAVLSGIGNRLRINRLQSNVGLAIDLGNDGVTQNDPGDADIGPNGLQNTPVLTTAAVVNGVVNVQGELNSTSQTTFTIDLYVSAACHASETGEGGQWFGAFTVTTNADGNAAFNVNFGGGVVSPGQIVSAIATSGDFVSPEAFGEGSTSEFSGCVQAALP
ncbi:MAG: putative Ig domain-containing protein, partial [Acidobacteriales bacterium]|nr:putative Ig domain-containing protein [Terriglobales bacterium]